MKRISLILCMLLCLSGCVQPKAAPSGYTPAYSVSTVPFEADIPSFYRIFGNGSLTLGVAVRNYDKGTSDTCYALECVSGSVTSSYLFAPEHLFWGTCLGIDGQNGIWYQGQDAQTSTHLVRYNTSGSELLNIDLGDQLPLDAVYAFSWDSDSYYFLARGNDDAWLIRFDPNGQELFRRSLAEYAKDTVGYLDVEEDWLEDLEGREGEPLLEMLFPQGPVNQIGLLRFQDGSVGMMIRRQSPIDAEAYGIICTLEDNCSRAVPQYAYELETEYSICLCTYFESATPDYDLLVTSVHGLYGINLQKQDKTLLLTWEDADYSPAELSDSIFPSLPPRACPAPGGGLWFFKAESLVQLSPTA